MADKDQTPRRLCCAPLRWILLVADMLCLVAAAAAVALIMLKVKPFSRGFYCDDRSISKPYKRDTISRTVLILVCCLVPAIMILSTELFHFFKNSRQLRSDVICWGACRNCFALHVAAMYVVFLFGAIFTILLTNVGKYSTGVLRPHFLEVCKPDVSRVNCSDGFIEEEVCTGDPKLIKEARLSFPSAHASLVAYAMGFVVLYMEVKIQSSISKLLKPTIQLVAIILVLGTAYSRVSDYHHHWSDVVAGLVIGAAMAGFVSCRVLKLSHRSRRDVVLNKSISVATIDTQL